MNLGSKVGQKAVVVRKTKKLGERENARPHFPQREKDKMMMICPVGTSQYTASHSPQRWEGAAQNRLMGTRLYFGIIRVGTSIEYFVKCLVILGPVVQKLRLKINQGVYSSTPPCCLTLIFSKTLD